MTFGNINSNLDKKTLLGKLTFLPKGLRDILVVLFFNQEAWVNAEISDQYWNRLGQLTDKPCSYVGIRRGLVKKVEGFQGSQIMLNQLIALFEQGDELTLGEFQPLGGSDDIFSRMNHWYFCSLGLKAFALEGDVPYRFPNSALIQKADARRLYWRVADGELGQGGEQVVVKRWGSGVEIPPTLAQSSLSRGGP